MLCAVLTFTYSFVSVAPWPAPSPPSATTSPPIFFSSVKSFSMATNTNTNISISHSSPTHLHANPTSSNPITFSPNNMTDTPPRRDNMTTPDEARFTPTTLLTTFESSTSFVISAATFGGAVFASILTPIRDPPRFSIDTVRIFLAMAWLCLALCLVVVGFARTFLKVLGKGVDYDGGQGQAQKAKGEGGEVGTREKDENMRKLWHTLGMVVWCALYGLITSAFVFLALVLVAYVGAVGWVALGFACLVGSLSIVWVILEVR